MHVRHADAIDDAADDADEALVGAADKEIAEMAGCAVEFLLRGAAINGTIIVPGEAADGADDVDMSWSIARENLA